MRLRSKGLPFGTRDGVAARARFTGRAGTPIARKHPENFPVFGVFSCLLKKSGTCPDFFVAPEALHFMRSAARRDFWVQKSLRDFWIGVNLGARGRRSRRCRTGKARRHAPPALRMRLCEQTAYFMPRTAFAGRDTAAEPPASLGMRPEKKICTPHSLFSSLRGFNIFSSVGS